MNHQGNGDVSGETMHCFCQQVNAFGGIPTTQAILTGVLLENDANYIPSAKCADGKDRLANVLATG